MNSLLNVIQSLLEIDINNYHQVPDEVCRVLMNTLPELIFVSLLTYNKNTDEIIYRSITFDEKAFDKSTITELIKPFINLKISDSTSGRLISSNKRYLICKNVLEEPDYQSVELAKFFGFKAGIFLELRDLLNKEIYGVLILYPKDRSTYITKLDGQYQIIISTIESILSNAKRIKESIILNQILDAAKKVRKDLSSFLQKCIEITSREISAKGCSIFVVDPEDHLIKLKATLGIKPGPKYVKDFQSFTRKQVFYKRGQGNTGNIVETNRPLIKHSMDISESKWLEETMSSTFLGVPISKIDEDKAIGVLRCATRPNQLVGTTLEAFNHEDLQLANYIASLLSVFIELSFYHDQQKQFITKMPHEIKASLTNIVSICEYLDIVYQEARNTQGTYIKNFETKIKDILSECDLSVMTMNSLSAFEDSIEAYDFELTDIFTGIIAKIRKMLNPLALSERNVQIVYDNKIQMPAIYVDKFRMQLVFHNLLINAIKYSYYNKSDDPQSNIIIQSELDQNKKYYIISVSNIGIPISNSQKDDLFINGYRTLDAIRIDPSGKGFGLALVHSILKIQGCDIKVIGLRNPIKFAIYFPVELSENPPQKQHI